VPEVQIVPIVPAIVDPGAGVNSPGYSLVSKILTNRNEFHLGCDYSLARVPELRHWMIR